jgi:hypothetical protein
VVLQSYTCVEVGDGEMVPKEMRVTSSNNGVGEKESGGSVIGVKSVALPRIMAKNHIGLHNANESHQGVTHFHSVFEFAVYCAEESN